MEENQNQTPQDETMQNQVPQYETVAQSKPTPQRGVAHIAALVLGIISILGSGFLYIGLPTGILAIVLGAKSAKRTGSKLGKAGVVTGIVGISILVLLYVAIIFIAYASSL